MRKRGSPHFRVINLMENLKGSFYVIKHFKTIYFLALTCFLFGPRWSPLTYGIKRSTAGGSVSIAVMSEQLTPQLAV